ncbi:MAG: hypothetical protein LBG64_03550 [Pseudomonadales bacterium]|jgi:hypothetical protein|nr:hypothetical protein [Pseudomonadales bacterium]
MWKLLIISLILGSSLLDPNLVAAQGFTTRVTVSNPRFSFVSALATGNTAGSHEVTIVESSAEFDELGSLNLVHGDRILIGSNYYLVNLPATSPPNIITLDASTPLQSGDIVAGTSVINVVSGFQQVGFRTTRNVPNGTIRFLIPAVSNLPTANDGIPDRGTFDFGNGNLTCPPSAIGFNFLSPILLSADTTNFTIGGTPFHIMSCPYLGTGPMNTDFGINNSNHATVTGLINPRPMTGTVAGRADFLPWIVQHLDSFGNIVDSNLTMPAYVEGTRLRAEILPYFSFMVYGVTPGTLACGTMLGMASTPTLLDFGEVTMHNFRNLAHRLAVTTNYPGGYVVTIQSNDQMGLIQANSVPISCPGSGIFHNCISNATVTGMSHTNTMPWHSISQGTGLAFTIENITGSDNVFDYRSGYRHLPDISNDQSPQPILRSNRAMRSTNFVCYRLVPSGINIPGYYQNTIIYTATASF